MKLFRITAIIMLLGLALFTVRCAVHQQKDSDIYIEAFEEITKNTVESFQMDEKMLELGKEDILKLNEIAINNMKKNLIILGEMDGKLISRKYKKKCKLLKEFCSLYTEYLDSVKYSFEESEYSDTQSLTKTLITKKRAIRLVEHIWK